MVLFSSDSSKAAASSAAFVSVDESRYTIILAARTKESKSRECIIVLVSSIAQASYPGSESFEPKAHVCYPDILPASRCGMEFECLMR